VLVGQVLQLKIDPGKPRLAKQGAVITGARSRSSLVTALTLLTCKFYQFRLLHSLRSLGSGSNIRRCSPHSADLRNCSGRIFCVGLPLRTVYSPSCGMSADKEKKCDSSNYG
jgi:hypothetical protein